MRRHARIDANQPEIVKALRDMGATVQSLAAVGKGCPDLLVGYRSQNILIEVKDGSKPISARYLTPAECKWQSEWLGQVRLVENAQQAVDLVRLVTRERL